MSNIKFDGNVLRLEHNERANTTTVEFEGPLLGVTNGDEPTIAEAVAVFLKQNGVSASNGVEVTSKDGVARVVSNDRDPFLKAPAEDGSTFRRVDSAQAAAGPGEENRNSEFDPKDEEFLNEETSRDVTTNDDVAKVDLDDYDAVDA